MMFTLYNKNMGSVLIIIYTTSNCTLKYAIVINNKKKERVVYKHWDIVHDDIQEVKKNTAEDVVH